MTVKAMKAGAIEFLRRSHFVTKICLTQYKPASLAIARGALA